MQRKLGIGLMLLAVAGAVVAAVIVLAAGGDDGDESAEPLPPLPRADGAGGRGRPPVVAAAGDIACDADEEVDEDDCEQQATADLLDASELVAVLPLGDLQYEEGELSDFESSYDPTWGKLKEITRPAPGNHEYKTDGAEGYFDYFGSIAGERDKGWYSFNLGRWHLIALNSNCEELDGRCGADSEQVGWLRNDLATNRRRCTLAYWHHPRFSSGRHGNHDEMEPFWQALYDAGADVVLSGHDHSYERFAPQDPGGEPAPARGIRQFVVGTGGKSFYDFESSQPNSEVVNNDTNGILKLTLRPVGYAWQFVPEAGRSFTDRGSGRCH